MRKLVVLLFSMLVAELILSPTVFGQTATGIITGTVTDESGAVIPSAAISITNKATGAARNVTANAEGLYSAPALPPGEYEVRAEVQGFRTILRDAQVLAGGNTTVDIAMTLGATQEVVNVEAATAQINYESHNVQGVIQRQTIQDLPLNGRSFQQLATLEPGVVAVPASTSQFNSLFNIQTLGMTQALYTIDGGNVTDERDSNGISMNFSQEVVQEFQMSSATFDLSTGITAAASVNIVTRSGGNDFHGSGYFFYRDHNMAAYPALKRSSLNPNPFFARRNPGFWIGGPILKDKLFFFFNLEKMNQTQVSTVQEDLPSLAALSTVFPSPYHQTLLTARFDYRVSAKHTLFARYSHDGNSGNGGSGSAELSNYTPNHNWSDQSIMGVTSALTPNLVNDFRVQYHFWQNQNLVEPASACQFPCVGGGFPNIASMVGSSTFSAGANSIAIQVSIMRSYEEKDELSWQKGTHRLRFGFGFERMNTTNNPWDFCSLGCLAVYSPEQTLAIAGAANVANYFPTLPTTITTNADLLNLPVSNPTVASYTGFGIGPGLWPGPYDHNQNRHNSRPQAYVTDTWKARPSLTINAGLRYVYESGLFPTDLPHPGLLAPIFGANNLGPTPSNKLDFSPVLGFAWAIGKDKKTVIRGGGGLYWDTQPLNYRFRVDAAYGPVGDGRSMVGANAFTNIFPGILNFTTGGTAIPIGASLPTNALTNMTLGQFIQIYNQELPRLNQLLAPTNVPTSGPYTVSGLDVAKQGARIFPPQFPIMRSYQTSIGVQRDLGHDMVLTADWARRQFENVQLTDVDLNRFNRFINGVQTPVIPVCSPSQAFVAGQECSLGGISFTDPEGRSVYDGLLVKVQKHFSKRYQFVASYALQKNLAVNTTVVNLDNYFAGYGPNLARHNLNVAGVVDLPWGFKLSVNNSIISRTPVEPIIPGIDINGSGITNYPISEASSGDSYACFAAGCGKSQLAAAVASFNATYAGHKDARGQTIPALILPPNYEFGDPTFNTDFRLTKEFSYKERYRLSIFGEMFNAFNIANLSGYSYSLNSLNANPAKQAFSFGQPTQRFGQVFGSGGPRAIQVGGRFTF